MTAIIASLAIYYVICIIIAVFTLVCLWIVFSKAGRPGWAAIIPIYNWVVLCQIAGYSGLYFLLVFIPVINIIFMFFLYVGLAERFGQGTLFGIGLFLLGPIFLAIMAFNKNIQYEYGGGASSSAASAPNSAGSTREYYEKKAAESAQPSALEQRKPAPIAMSKVSATAPLPSLPPTVDDAAAQDSFAIAGEMEAKGEKEKAIEHYTKAIRLNSRHTAAYFKRGTLLMEMKFKPAALADFRRVIEFADNPELTEIAKANIATLGK
jgi:tetratricopeptide (TPR) repeat protein